MTKPILIGLHGKPRSGKDTLAAHLIAKHNLLRYGPSVRVKDTTAVMFDFPRWYLDDDKMKEAYDPFWKMTYREMAQKVGKESSRDVFGDDIWMRHVEKQLLNLQGPRLCKCSHNINFHTIDAPMDYMGCTECNCSEWREVETIKPNGIILADIRYASEVEWVKAHHGNVIFIVRDNLPVSSGGGHPAEAGLPLDLADIVVYNNSTIAHLYEQADVLFRIC